MKQEKLNTIIANNVKKYRKKRNMSIKELSYFTDITYSTLENIENCKESISIIMLYKISKVLKISINNFFEENND